MNEIVKKLENLDFLTIKEDSNATIVKQISTMPKLKKEDYIKQGIDFETAIKNTHIEEMFQNISKKIFQDIVSIGMSNDVTDINLDSIINKQIREEKLKELFGEEVTKTPIYQNTHTMQRLVYMSIVNKTNKLDANIIVTNVAMGAALQNLSEFNSVYSGGGGSVINHSMHQYKVGRISNCDVYVDAYMRFDDNRIIVANVDYEVSHNDSLNFNNDFMEMDFGYDQKINPNSKVEVLNIIDTNMFLI